jgi:tetratricopeptide (TPR) repeat protein
MITNERIGQLEEFLKQDPNDLFSLFAMAMEFQSLERFADALEYFDRVLAIDSHHVPVYYQKAQILVKLVKIDDARNTLKAGMPEAVKSGQLHARDRMQELLDILDSSGN